MPALDRVANVVTREGTDITDLVNAAADRESCSARGLLGLFFGETSSLSETARRPRNPADDLRYWPDVSGGVGQQTILYAAGYGLGNGSSNPDNIAAVMEQLFNPEVAIPIAAKQYGSFYRLTGDHFEACAKYNGGPSATWASIPGGNQQNYLDGWRAAGAYLDTGTEPSPGSDWAPIDVRDRYPFAPGNGVYQTRDLGTIQQVVYHHGDSALPEPTQDAELAMLDAYYQLHIKQDGVHGWPSIGYHLAVGSSGTVYYLNGLDLISYHAGNWPINVHGIGIVFIGRFEHDPPPHSMIETAIQARQWAARQCGHADFDYSGHKDWSGTACPGNWWPSQRGLLSESEDPDVIAALQQKIADQDSYIGAVGHDVVYKARVLLDRASETLPADPELIQQAIALLKTAEIVEGE
jgi:hypothetical protein